MPRLQTRKTLAANARAAAASLGMVEYQDILYMPVDYETGVPGEGEPDRTVWRRQSLQSIRIAANTLQDILFSSEGEFRSFTFMVKQFATAGTPDLSLLVPVRGQGVRRLAQDGTLAAPTGEFIPATLGLEFDPEVDTSEVWEHLCGWVDSEDQAHALLRHLSVGFQPWWTASKYLLFIGDGSNGKSTLLKMLYKLVGTHSVSQVTRQDMSSNRPVVTQLNGAIMNIVFDGSKKFLSDSASEKTLIAGEPLSLELKYENIPTIVQTNALFLEGLNTEPKTGDHSGGFHRRLERFHFPNVYAKDRNFERRMLSNKSLSALLKLILEHWVPEEEAGARLASTEESKELQLEQLWSNNPLMQYLEFLSSSPEVLEELVKPNALVDTLVTDFRHWAENNGYRNYDDGYIRQLINEMFVSARKTIRINGKPTSRRVIVEWKENTRRFMDRLLEDPHVV